MAITFLADLIILNFFSSRTQDVSSVWCDDESRQCIWEICGHWWHNVAGMRADGILWTLWSSCRVGGTLHARTLSHPKLWMIPTSIPSDKFPSFKVCTPFCHTCCWPITLFLYSWWISAVGTLCIQKLNCFLGLAWRTVPVELPFLTGSCQHTCSVKW